MLLDIVDKYAKLKGKTNLSITTCVHREYHKDGLYENKHKCHPRCKTTKGIILNVLLTYQIK